MTIRGPFAVVVDDGSGPREVTAKVEMQGWSKAARGGDIDVSFRLHDRVSNWDLGPDASIAVYDTRIGEQTWSGRATLPGRSQSDAGEYLDVQGLGAARLEDQSAPLLYVSRDMTQLRRSRYSTKGAVTETGELDDDTPTVEVSWPQKKDVAANEQGSWVDRRFQRAGLTIGGLRVTVAAGIAASNYVMRLQTALGSDAPSSRDTRAAAVSAARLLAARGGSNLIPAGHDVAFLAVTRETSTVTATDSHWFRFYSYAARQVIKDVNGADLAGSTYANPSIYAHEVIADLVGRGLIPDVDASSVSIASTSYPIDNLDFIEGATPAAVLDALLLFEPDLWWRYSAPSFETGLFDETNPRYVLAPSHGGIEQPGEEGSTLCTRVQVNWTDDHGENRTTYVGTVGRDAEPVSLPPGLGSPANAVQYGNAILAAASKPPKAGTAVLRKPVQDLWAGCFVQPWEVEPGHCVVEQSTGDVFRLDRFEWDAPNGSARVTFGTPRRTPEQVLAQIDKQLRRKARRR